MSRKSRQKGARKLLRKAMPLWLALPLFIVALAFGIFCTVMPILTQPPTLEDTTAVSATLQSVEPTYRIHRRHTDVHAILLHFTDHEMLRIPEPIATDKLLDKLEDCPPGTILDMLVEKADPTDVLAISATGTPLLTFEAACRAITVNHWLGFGLGILFLGLAGYFGWCLVTAWRYRQLT